MQTGNRYRSIESIVITQEKKEYNIIIYLGTYFSVEYKFFFCRFSIFVLRKK